MTDFQVIGFGIGIVFAWLIGTEMGGAAEWKNHRPFCSCKECRKWMKDHA